jgi:serine/threonine protein kinase
MKEIIPGQTISHYRITEKLGEGGMGVVYKAHDTTLDRNVALKFLPHYLTTDPNEKERFYHEARAAAALMHQNVAVIHEISEYDGQVFISMEYVEGETIKKIIENKSESLTIKKILEIALKVCEGLAAAHEKNIVHRDIKSDNIMLTSKEQAKIMDFGLAKLKGATKLTKEGSTVGTAAYMSPEQAQGEDVDNRSDIFSFGVVLYEMLTTHLPFPGEHQAALIYSLLNETPQPVARFNDKVSQELERIVFKALEKDKEERYQHADDMLADLRKERKSLEYAKSGYVKASAINQISKEKTSGITIKNLRIIILIAVVVLLVALSLILKPFGLWEGQIPSSRTIKETEAIKTIAVLPFVNMSSDPNQEYFSDGISDELINRLSRNPKLRVTARTSSFYFKGKDVNIKTIAQTLNVKHILEGSVRKSGNNLRISADLVNAETEATLWFNTYDGTMNNIFALQDSISGNVAEALNTALLGKEAKPEQKINPEAYNNYLLGNHFFELWGKENFEKAEIYFNKAISIDSSYAPAWVGLSQTHSRLADGLYIPHNEGFTKASREAEKALELNPNLADAYAQMGWIRMVYNWDWIGADETFKKGLELELGNVNISIHASELATTLGRFDEAIKLLNRVIEIDPVNLAGYHDLGIDSRRTGAPDESIAYFKKCLELKPQSTTEHMLIGLNYLEKGKADSAMVEMQKETSQEWQTFGFAIVYCALGRKMEADDKLAKFIQSDWAYQIAEIYAYRNEKDKAFEWLDKAYKQRDGGLTEIVGEPLLRNIVKDPRYAPFMKKMKLPM